MSITLKCCPDLLEWFDVNAILSPLLSIVLLLPVYVLVRITPARDCSILEVSGSRVDAVEEWAESHLRIEKGCSIFDRGSSSVEFKQERREKR